MGYPISLSNNTKPLTFLMVLASDHITGATGKSPTVTISKNGGAFATPAGSVSEIGSGIYALSANATDANTLGPLLLHATASGCDPRDDTFDVVNYNPASVHPYSPPTTATFGTVTALDLIKRALDDIGVYSPGETLSAADAQDGLRRLNGMVSSWATQPLTIPATVREVFDLVANQGGPSNPYTIGPNGDFDTVRPIYLQGAGLMLTATSPEVEIPLGLFTDDAYQAIQVKDLASTLPTGVYYNKTFPLGQVQLWPVPNNATNDLVIYSYQALSGFADLTTQYAFAPGYEEALEYQLAVRLAIPHARPIDPELKSRAGSALKWIKAANSKLTDLRLDPGLTVGSRGIYNILTDLPS